MIETKKKTEKVTSILVLEMQILGLFREEKREEDVNRMLFLLRL